MMNEKKDKSYKKDFEHTVQIVHELTEEEVTISGLSYTTKKGEFFFDGTYLSVLLNENMKDTPPNRLQLYIHTKSRTYKTSDSHVLTYQYHEGETLKSRSGIIFNQLMDTQWDHKAKYFYRLYLPIERSWSNLWFNLIECSTFQVDPCDSHFEEGNNKGCLIKIGASEGQIHVFPIHVENMGFLIIESQFPCTYNDMNRYMYAISLSFGLVTTVAPFDYAIVVASKTPDFDREIMGGIVKLRPTIKSQHRFITTDIRELYENLKEKVDYDAFRPYCDKEGNLLKSYLDLMTEQEFSALTRRLYENRALARAALMLIDSSMNLECLGAIYAVALETICSVLIEANKEFLPKHLKKNGEEGKRKNKEKLTEPFMLPQIGYELSEEKGKELVNIRNSFLHGGVLGFSHTEYHKLLYSSMELRKLCGILLFRYAGYKGPILNNAVVLGLEEAIANKEPLFITYEEKTESPQPTKEPEAGV